jgi:transposase
LVLALVITRQGLPIYHEVLPGNTADVTTLGGVAKVLSARFNIGKVVFVCDRGIISRENLEQLEELEFPYIIGLRLRNNQEARSLYRKSLSGFQRDESLGGLLIKEKHKGDYRYIQCHNPEVAKEKKTNRERRIKKVEDRVKSLERLFDRRRISAEELYHRVCSILEEQRLSKFFKPEIQSGKIILYMDSELLQEESYLDGKFFLKTNIKTEELPAAEVVKSYKQLQEVERSFRELKDFLKIRPIFHYSDDRVKAHVFICVLGYLFEKLIEMQCRRASLRYTGRRALSLLARFKAIECKVAGHPVTVTNRIDQEIGSIMEAVGVSFPSQVIGNRTES